MSALDDVVLLGSGLGGTLLASCLAAQGLSVRLLDAATHPRFAIGEATTPDTSFRLKLLALKYGVPEIGEFGSFYRVRDAIGPSSGIKRAFSFVYHRPGQDQVADEVHQYPTFAPPLGPDVHLFRQDTDAWMLAVAARYGATVHQATRVERFDIRPDEVRLDTQCGQIFRARFVVDAAGFASPLARQLDLNVSPDGMHTNSRALFTHMVGVPAYDLFGPPVTQVGIPYPLSQSTLHHVFPGGWMWVIPFNNHLDHVNALCSVGLLLDRDQHPEFDGTPEEEFRAFVEQYPSIGRQFANARALRPWVRTGRIQRRTSQMVGDRWALMAHAAGFVDPLYSSGLNLTAGTVDQLATRIASACREDCFVRAHFEPVEARFERNLAIYDRVVGNSYRSFGDFDLWDSWYRVWVISLLIGTGVNGNLYMRLVEGASPDALLHTDQPPFSGVLGSEVPLCRTWLDRAFAEFDRLDQGVAAADVAHALREQFRHTPCAPTYWQWHDPSVRATPSFTVWGLYQLYRWFHKNAPPELARTLFDIHVWTLIRYLGSRYLQQRRLSGPRSQRFLRDALRAWNSDVPTISEAP